MERNPGEKWKRSPLGTVMGRKSRDPGYNARCVPDQFCDDEQSYQKRSDFISLLYKVWTLDHMTQDPCQFKILRCRRQSLQYLKRLRDTDHDSQGCTGLLERCGFVTLQHSWMGLEKNRKDVSCVICVWPLKRKHTPCCINSHRMLSIFHPTQTGPTQTLPQQLYIISLCSSSGTYCLSDSRRRIL